MSSRGHAPSDRGAASADRSVKRTTPPPVSLAPARAASKSSSDTTGAPSTATMRSPRTTGLID